MVGRLLSNIDKEIRSTSSQLRRQCLLADRAGVLTRLGEFAEAKSQLDQLRLANTGYDASLTSRILLGEGLLCHFAYDIAGARDKFRRAHAISTAVGDKQLKALAAAWLSVNELHFDNIAAAAEKAAEAIQDALPTDHAALARSHLVIADLLNYCGVADEAKRHYDVARQHAVEEGDLSMQSLVLYNYATFRVHRLALQAIAGPIDAEQASLAEMNVASIGTLDHGIGNRSFARLVPLQHGQVLAMQGKWEAALQKFGENIEYAHKESLAREALKALAARVLCHKNLKNDQEMQADLDLARERISDCTDLDDLAIVHHRLHLATADVRPAEADMHRGTYERCVSAFRERQDADLRLIRLRLPVTQFK